MLQWLNNLPVNGVSVILAGVVAVSVLMGWHQGALGTTRQLFGWIAHVLSATFAALSAWFIGIRSSRLVQDWLERLDLSIPGKDMNVFEQGYYTFMTSLRDFSLFRTVFLMLLLYCLIKPLIMSLLWFFSRGMNFMVSPAPLSFFFLHRAAGAIVGGGLGVVRALIIVAVLYTFLHVSPWTGWNQYIEGSKLYQKGAQEVIEPLAGNFIERQALVFANAFEAELKKIWQRRYDIMDAHIPENIRDAALAITENAETDEEKARALYHWLGTRIRYDWEKVRLYEQEKIWKEQTPEETFEKRKGVCIDYARLYAMMARAAGLRAKVVTGLGADGRGGYGPHAWNEVYLSEQNHWVPLDSTWVASGGNWFNPPDFYQTHIKETA